MKYFISEIFLKLNGAKREALLIGSNYSLKLQNKATVTVCSQEINNLSYFCNFRYIFNSNLSVDNFIL